MSSYFEFEGRIVPMEWGTSVYTVLPLPDHISKALSAEGAKRVEGEINDHPVNLALTKAPVMDATFLYTGKSVLKAIDATPGQTLFVRLRKADPDHVDVPTDVVNAVRSAELTVVWQKLTPGRKRGLLHSVATAKRAETRARRIASLLDEIRP